MSTILLSRSTVANIYNPQNQTKEQLIDSFVVRQQLFKKLFKVIKEAKMEVPEQHYLILGRRGMGKTTLLLRLAYEIQNDPALNNWLIPLVFNEEEYGIHRLFKFWERVMELLEEKHPSFRFEGETLRQLSRQHTDHDTYEKALFEWLSEELKRNGKKLVLFIDNFGEMSRKLSDAEAHRLRKILQTSSDIRVVAASSVVLEAFYKYDHAFYEFFKQVELKGLDEKETRDLLLSLSRHYKKEDVQRVVEQNPGRVEALRRITGGVIRSIVLLFEIFADDGDGSAFHDLQVILDRTSPLYKHRMDDLSDQQQAIVEAIALNWDAISVKEIVEQTRLDSKVVSAQLNGLEKNGIIEKRATRTKNHLYLVAERFFNIWFLMRLGRKADQKRVLWLVRFFEDWCDKDLIKSRSQSHIAALHRGTFDPEGAFYITQAMAGVKDLDIVSRHKMLEETRTYLSGLDRELAESLSQSDLDVALEAIEKWYAGERKAALGLLKTVRPFIGSKINELLEKATVVPAFDDIEERVLRTWQEAMDGFTCDIGWIFNDDLQKSEVAVRCFEHGIQADYPRAMNSLGVLFKKEFKYLEKAEEWYMKAAEKGHSGAMFNLGLLYKNEHKDLQKAEEWYMKAAKKGHSGAIFNLGLLYKNEHKDLQKAEEWYLKAAGMGDVDAMLTLGWIYQNEHKDLQKAEEWYLKAAGMGDVDAMLTLGWIYQNEHKDLQKAEEWYLKAAEMGDVDAMLTLGWIYQNEHKDLQKAEEWFLKAAEKDQPNAMFNLGWIYQNEHKDLQKAEEWFLKAAEKDQPYAMNNLGRLYQNEHKDLQKAEEWYLKAAEKDQPNAMFNLGWIYQNEHKDLQKAEEWFLKAAEKDHPNAMNNLGRLYQNEHKDLQKAEEWFLKAAEKDQPYAMNNLGRLYQNEHKDLQKAEEWFLKAAEKDQPYAMNNLGRLYQNEHKDLQKAEEWFLKAAGMGDVDAMLTLGLLYQNEHKDLQKAEDWFLKAAEKNSASGMYALALFNRYERNDLQKALAWCEKAAALGSNSALSGIGWLLFELIENKEKALESAAQAFMANPDNSYFSQSYARVLLWHNRIDEALEVARPLLQDQKYQEEYRDDFVLFLSLLLAKNQAQPLYNIFISPQGQEQNFKDRFKPIWYAILKKLDHPDFLRMGDELSQTVEEVLAKADQLAIDYK